MQGHGMPRQTVAGRGLRNQGIRVRVRCDIFEITFETLTRMDRGHVDSASSHTAVRSAGIPNKFPLLFPCHSAIQIRSYGTDLSVFRS